MTASEFSGLPNLREILLPLTSLFFILISATKNSFIIRRESLETKIFQPYTQTFEVIEVSYYLFKEEFSDENSKIGP